MEETRDNRSSYRIAAFVLALFLVPAIANATVTRILLDPESELPDGPFTGQTQIVVAPLFDDARVAVAIDGKTIMETSRAPYTVEIDLGRNPVERRLTVTAVSASTRKKMQWSRILNRGHQPLSIALRVEGQQVEAVATAPKNDPITEVTFWESGELIARLQQPPYTIQYEGAGDGELLLVTARTRSGAEVADHFSARFDVMADSFEVRSVPLFVSVSDVNGQTRTDLRRDQFRIFDDGQEARIVEFGRAADLPIAASVLIDASGSMELDIDQVKSAAQQFVRSIMRPEDRFSVYSFQTAARREIPLTSNRQEVLDAIKGIEVGGRTALYDTLYSAIRELRDQTSQRAIIVLTDGDDTSSMRAWEDLVTEAKIAGIPIYAITWGEEYGRRGRGIDNLRFLTGQTGGFLTDARNPRQLAQRYKSIEDDLRARYLIRYEVAGAHRPNQWRPIRVSVAGATLQPRAIRGYFSQ
jgi:VWFA-related protein